MPMVFMTVKFALGEQAMLQAGERVLIHSAAGGVGLAAIQYAQRVGAEVFATASAPKHEYLRSLGVKHISTTRDERRVRSRDGCNGGRPRCGCGAELADVA